MIVSFLFTFHGIMFIKCTSYGDYCYSILCHDDEYAITTALSNSSRPHIVSSGSWNVALPSSPSTEVAAAFPFAFNTDALQCPSAAGIPIALQTYQLCPHALICRVCWIQLCPPSSIHHTYNCHSWLWCISHISCYSVSSLAVLVLLHLPARVP